MPDAQPLALLRTNIDRKPHKIKDVLMDAGIRKHILQSVPKDEKKAIKAFASQNTENVLKTKPKVCVCIFFVGHQASNALCLKSCRICLARSKRSSGTA